MAITRMTQGNCFRCLITYCIPLILGNLFQLTYNAADSAIVGRFIGRNALASVGTAGPVMNIIILSISGITVGASVIMSEFFGAGEEEMLKKEMATTAVFGLLFSLAVILIGCLSAVPLLKALQVPDEILEDTAVYLRIIFLSAPFTYFYNALAAALKSLGDSKTPLKFLAFASILNAALDLVFVGILGFGIFCSAVTTILAEACSAALCALHLYRHVPLLRLAPHEFRIDGRLLARTLRYGGITALQQSCQPIGKLLIQGAVNTLGIDAIAAFQAAVKIDDYAFTPEQSIANGITTFTAQNRGAHRSEEYGNNKKKRRTGRFDRITQGFLAGLILEFGYWILICSFVTLLKRPLTALFVGSGSEEVIRLGADYLGLMAVFYVLPAFTNGMQGYFRGMGQLKMTLLGTFIQTSLRVFFVYLLVPVIGIRGIAYACAIGWSIMLAVEIPFYFLTRRKVLPR